jgi:hypothetical protein
MTNEQTDFRALCAELTDRLQHAITSANADSYYGENRDAVDRARAALAQPEPEATHDLSDAAPLLWLLWNHLGSSSSVGQPIRQYLGMGRFESMSDAQIGAANQYRALLPESSRAALAQPEPEGVGVTDFEEELMAAWDKAIWLPRTGRLAEYRAWLAHVLALVWAVGRRPAIKPVPVSERLPGPEDCDAEGRCWYFFVDSVVGGCGWQMFNDEEKELLTPSHFWLPHHVLPVPQQPH